eukprot:gene1877-4973_t
MEADEKRPKISGSDVGTETVTDILSTQICIEGHTEVPVAEYSIDGKEEHVKALLRTQFVKSSFCIRFENSELKAASRAFQVINRLDFDNLHEYGSSPVSNNYESKDRNELDQSPDPNTKSIRDSRTENFEVKETDNLRGNRPQKEIETYLTSVIHETYLLNAALNMTQKTSYLDIERVAGHINPIEMDPSVRLKLKLQHIRRSTDMLNNALTRLQKNIQTSAHHFEVLARAVTKYRVIQNEGELVADIAPRLRVGPLCGPSGDFYCRLNFTPDSNDLHALAPIHFRANTDIRVYIGLPDLQQFVNVSIPVPKSDWNSVLETVTRNAFHRQLFFSFAREAPLFSRTCKMIGPNILAVGLDQDVSIVICLHTSSIPSDKDDSGDSRSCIRQKDQTIQNTLEVQPIRDFDFCKTTCNAVKKINMSRSASKSANYDEDVRSSLFEDKELRLLLLQLYTAMCKRKIDRELRSSQQLYTTPEKTQRECLSLFQNFAAITRCKIYRRRISTILSQIARTWQNTFSISVSEKCTRLHCHTWSISVKLGAACTDSIIELLSTGENSSLQIAVKFAGHKSLWKWKIGAAMKGQLESFVKSLFLNTVLTYISTSHIGTVCKMRIDGYDFSGIIQFKENRVIECRIPSNSVDIEFNQLHRGGPFEAPSHRKDSVYLSDHLHPNDMSNSFGRQNVQTAISAVLYRL